MSRIASYSSLGTEGRKSFQDSGATSNALKLYFNGEDVQIISVKASFFEYGERLIARPSLPFRLIPTSCASIVFQSARAACGAVIGITVFRVHYDIWVFLNLTPVHIEKKNYHFR